MLTRVARSTHVRRTRVAILTINVLRAARRVLQQVALTLVRALPDEARRRAVRVRTASTDQRCRRVAGRAAVRELLVLTRTVVHLEVVEHTRVSRALRAIITLRGLVAAVVHRVVVAKVTGSTVILRARVTVDAVRVRQAAVVQRNRGAITRRSLTDLCRTRVVVRRAVRVLRAATGHNLVQTLLSAHIARVLRALHAVITRVIDRLAVIRVVRVQADRRIVVEVAQIHRRRSTVITVVVVRAALLTAVEHDRVGRVALIRTLVTRVDRAHGAVITVRVARAAALRHVRRVTARPTNTTVEVAGITVVALRVLRAALRINLRDVADLVDRVAHVERAVVVVVAVLVRLAAALGQRELTLRVHVAGAERTVMGIIGWHAAVVRKRLRNVRVLVLRRSPQVVLCVAVLHVLHRVVVRSSDSPMSPVDVLRVHVRQRPGPTILMGPVVRGRVVRHGVHKVSSVVLQPDRPLNVHARLVRIGKRDVRAVLVVRNEPTVDRLVRLPGHHPVSAREHLQRARASNTVRDVEDVHLTAARLKLPTLEVHQLIARVEDLDPLTHRIRDVTRGRHDLVDHERARLRKLAVERVRIMHTLVVLALVQGRGVRVVAVRVRHAAVRCLRIRLVDARSRVVRRVLERADVQRTRVAVIAPRVLRAAAKLRRSIAALLVALLDVLVAHVRHARVGGLAVRVHVAAKRVILRHVLALVRPHVTRVRRAVVPIIAVRLGVAATLDRLVHARARHITVIRRAQVAVVTDARTITRVRVALKALVVLTDLAVLAVQIVVTALGHRTVVARVTRAGLVRAHHRVRAVVGHTTDLHDLHVHLVEARRDVLEHLATRGHKTGCQLVPTMRNTDERVRHSRVLLVHQISIEEILDVIVVRPDHRVRDGDLHRDQHAPIRPGIAEQIRRARHRDRRVVARPKRGGRHLRGRITGVHRRRRRLLWC